MTDKELREKAENVWDIHYRLIRYCGGAEAVMEERAAAIDAIALALKDAYRQGMEAMLDAAMRHKNGGLWPDDRGQIPVDELLEEAARLLEATPNETTREAIEEAERGEVTTCNDAQTFFAHLGLDEEEKL